MELNIYLYDRLNKYEICITLLLLLLLLDSIALENLVLLWFCQVDVGMFTCVFTFVLQLSGIVTEQAKTKLSVDSCRLWLAKPSLW